MNLPPVAPDVAADAVATLPARLRARLDAALQQADQWTITLTSDGAVVALDGQNTVTLTFPVEVSEHAVCSCLLSPRCLHRTAVLCAAPILAHDAGTDHPAAPEPVQADPATTTGAPLPEPQRLAAEALWNAAASVLENGIAGAGATVQADLLRAIHQARAVGLPRPATAAVRVVERLRAARAAEPSFRLADLTDDLWELLLTCHNLTGDLAGQDAARGIARREYEAVGDLRLYGLFCEPVLAASGYVGAATYLADDQAQVWAVSTIRPGSADEARNAANTDINLGEVRISHRDLSRNGIRAANAYASADARLGHSRRIQAVRAEGAHWRSPPLDALWQPVTDQVQRWLAAGDQATHDRRTGHDLAFLDGVIIGATPGGFLLTVADVPGPVTVTPPHQDPSLPYVTNLRLLAERACGHPIRIIGRFTGPRRVHGLAFTADWLPQRLAGHADLGVDRLQLAELPNSATLPAPSAADDQAPPLHLIRHTVERVVSAGRAVLLAGVAADTRQLAIGQLNGAAVLLDALGAAGIRRTRDGFGRLNPIDMHNLARTWLAAATYAEAAAREATRLAWLNPHQ